MKACCAGCLGRNYPSLWGGGTGTWTDRQTDVRASVEGHATEPGPPLLIFGRNALVQGSPDHLIRGWISPLGYGAGPTHIEMRLRFPCEGMQYQCLESHWGCESNLKASTDLRRG